MYDHSLHRGSKKTFFRYYYLHTFNTEEILKRHIKDCFKNNSKKRLKCLKKVNMLNEKNFERKIKLPFMVYEYFESILVPGDNGKQIPNESYTNKCKKHVACSYGYKLVCADDKFSKLFKSYLGEDAVYTWND